MDLLNHADELVDEGVDQLSKKIKKMPLSLMQKAKNCAEHYGKVKTKKLLRKTFNEALST